jgi:mono/diheme cytochrome c family protein
MSFNPCLTGLFGLTPWQARPNPRKSNIGSAPRSRRPIDTTLKAIPTMNDRLLSPAWGLSLVIALVASEVRADDALTVEFNRDVRPILSENCYACHGPDARKRKGNLRLDIEAGAKDPIEGTDSLAVVPGKPDESEMLARVSAEDPTLVMPPPKTDKKLTAKQIDILRAWIASGANWEPHWSLAPVKKPKLAEVDAGGKALDPIDQFILAKLKDAGLSPSPEADRVTLIRRLSFDLTGLPPTPADVERFLSDDEPDAYDKLVDRLLASPHYGERMAMFWLDLVRYADSVGYHGDQAVSVSPFRDYVIKAFNENMPFDRFTIEQLAGDMLPDPTLDQKVAAGYNRLGMMSAEGGVQPKEYLAKYAAERVRNVSGAWLGVTLGCAECHDHKFDPLTARDFYRMEAFFADIEERGLYDGSNFGPTIPVPTGDQTATLARLDAELAAARDELNRPCPELADAQRHWEIAQSAGGPNWVVMTPLEAKSSGGATLKILDDGSVLASGTLPDKDTYTITAEPSVDTVTAFRLEAIADPSLPGNGPGRASNGNLVLSEFSVQLKRGDDQPPKSLALQNGSASFSQNGFAPAQIIDGNPNGDAGWAVLGAIGKTNEIVLETAADYAKEPRTPLTFTLSHNSVYSGHSIGRLRISATSAARPVKVPGGELPAPVREALAVAPESRSDAQRDALAAHYRTIAPILAPERKRLADAEKARNDFNATIPTMILTRTVPPRPIRVLPRGNWMDDSGEVVTPGVPAVLPQPETSDDERLTRLDLARWIVAPENPLTARVLANRLWKLYFGEGFSRKLDDLGAQGEWPSHPELLDLLSAQLTENGWDLKKMIKRIVTSQTYRQSSIPSKEAIEIDPTNRLLSHQARFRLDAELVRDNALAVSGLLAEELGGPSVKPYQPPGYWSFLNFPTREWQNDSGDKLYRRGLYTHWQRQYLYPSLMALDAPSREECTAQRVMSNTPLQALVLLNDPAFVEAARALAERAIRDGGPSPDSRLDWMFRRAVSRPIRPAESAVLTPLLTKHLGEYRADPQSARDLMAIGAHPAPVDLDPAELAAWTSIARAVLNLHSTILRN